MVNPQPTVLSRLRFFENLNFWQILGLMFLYVLVIDVVISLIAFAEVSFWGALVSMFYIQAQIFVILVFAMLFFAGLIMNEEIWKYLFMLVLLAFIFFLIALILNRGFGIDTGITMELLLDFDEPDTP
ncbi:MAG: hypothetical protein KAR35_03510 [Candidatus Heimdallarchaeota archaeon]|nr:hypothetical protein [Candidatus Heimdallarchaeota archaeon]MCK5048423.1 hypothetical protein [Candidatus Heimdallarchaeota archaeon]